MKVKIENYLKHVGVKGMKWGVRKSKENSGKGYSVDKDGRISIEKGFILQRIYNKNKQNSGEFGTNYFSFTKKDNDTYLTMLGAGAHSKIAFIKKLASDTISRSSAKERLKSPSREEAFNILNESLKNSGKKGFSGSFKDPRALEWYKKENARVVKSRKTIEFEAYKKALLKKGFNILLDESDAGFLSEMPILVLDGGRSIKKVTISDFSKSSLDAAKKRMFMAGMNRTMEEISKAGY